MCQRNRAGPRCPTRTRCRSGAAGGRRGGPRRVADRCRHAAPVGRQRCGIADAVAPRGPRRPAGGAAGRSYRGGDHRSARSHRAMGAPVAGVGCDPRPAAARRGPQMDGGSPSDRDRRAGGAAHHAGGQARPACARRAVARHRQGQGSRSQRARRRDGRGDRPAAGHFRPRHRSAVQAGPPPLVATGRGHPKRPE